VLSFFQNHILTGIGLLVGPVIAIGGLILHAHDLVTLVPSIYLAVFGLLLFFLSVIGILMKWDQQARSSAPAKAPASAPAIRVATAPPAKTTPQTPQRIPVVISPPPALTKDRIFVETTVEYLLKLIEGKMQTEKQRIIQPFVGKWLAMELTVTEVYTGQHHASVQDNDHHKGTSFKFNFDPKWNDRLDVLAGGQKAKVIGKIGDIEKWGMTLVECELI
jgi:hypothetical protein